MEEIEARVYGKVQMVMFRNFVEQKARGLSLSGIVQNLDDGSLKVIAQGTNDDLQRLIDHLHKGPFHARVLKVDVEWREPEGKYQGFSIHY